MNKLSSTGKKVARRSFAAFMAVLLCATALGTNFWGLGNQDTSSIVGSFEAFAADSVIYGPGETYYDAGTFITNAYYDGSTGTDSSSDYKNYHATDWDIIEPDKAESYVAEVEQNGHKGVTVLSTTDITETGKVGSASEDVDGGDGQRGIMCYSEYLGTDKKLVPDYEAPAGVKDVVYQYIAKGETTEVPDGDNQTEIKWTLFAWPVTQNLNGVTADAMKSALDTAAEIEAEWGKLNTTAGTDTDKMPYVPDKTETDSMFYAGQPQWYSGNQGAFDDWCVDGNYLKNKGLWSRIETKPIKIKDNAGTLSVEGTPEVSIALCDPSNPAEVSNVDLTDCDVVATLTESSDTSNLPLYTTYTGYSGNIESISLDGALTGQTDAKTAKIPTYNIRQQLLALWNTTSSVLLRKRPNNSGSLICRHVSNKTGTDETFTINADDKITGVRLYAIASYPRIDTNAIEANKDYINESTGGTINTIEGTQQWNSVYRNDKDYGSTKDTDETSPVMFVFNKDDVNSSSPEGNIVHADDLLSSGSIGPVFNMSDVYSAYDDMTLKKTDTATKVASNVTNIIAPFSIRSDAYYDVTDDYQRAAGVLYGRTDTPMIDTSAINTVTNAKKAKPAANDTIVDTVSYRGLTEDANYKLEGKIYKSTDTGFATVIAESSATLTAGVDGMGEVPVTFSFDSSAISSGDKLVVTEELKNEDGTVTIATHKDLSDADQTITYTTDPIITTKASLSDDKKTITDEISYLGLTANTKYVITTSAFDVTANKELEKVTTPFTPATVDGKTTVTYDKFDAEALAGHTLVMYESIATEAAPDTPVAEHKDKEDEAQTVILAAKEPVNANIVTVATSGTGSKYLDAIDSETIIDTVTVSDLDANKSYIARASLYDVTADKLVTDISNNPLSWQQTFTTDTSGKGEAVVTLDKFSASDKAGHKLVVYEDILDAASNVVVGTHADKADEQQTVTVNKAGIKTVLTDKDGNKSMTSSVSMNFKDDIKYSGLVPGNRYYMVSTLVDKETGKVLNDKSGHQAIVTSTVFRANTTGTNAGGSTFTFSNMATAMSGKTVVAFNDLYRVIDDTEAEAKVTDSVKAELVAFEHDLANADQTVVIDATLEIEEDTTIDTYAESVDGGKTIPMASHSTIKDTVTYTGLLPDKTYTLKADVYDIETGKRANGYTEVQSMDFAASETGNGEVVMTIDLNTLELAEHDLVVYETLYLGDVIIDSHRDMSDEDQTVTVDDEFQASIDTFATDKKTGSKTLMASSGTTILDTVSYDGLDTDTSYKLVTTVYDQATGTKCSNIQPINTTFTPEDESGTIEVNIPIDGTMFAQGQSLVVYEELKTVSETNGTKSTRSGSGSTKKKTITVAKHMDISDADQTVKFVKMSTYLTGDGTSSKTVHVGADAYVIDTASFTGLTPNRTYVINTQLIDIAAPAGAVTLDSNNSNSSTGQTVASRSMEFTPTTANGSISTQINVNTAELSGHSLVAVATVTDKKTGQTVVSHLDKANVDQTITVQTRVEAQTGVSGISWIFGMIALVMLSACASYGIGLYSDKKNNR